MALPGKAVSIQAWWPEFNPRNPEDGRRETTPRSVLRPPLAYHAMLTPAHVFVRMHARAHTQRRKIVFKNASTRGGVSLSGYQNRVVNGGIYYNMIWGPGRQINKLEWNKLESPKTAPNIYKELIHDKKMRTKELGYLHTKMCVCFISFNQVFVVFSQVDMCTLLPFNINI